MTAKLIAGVDEAGRGPLAGPVVAASVILHPDHPIDGLMDSKKLSAAKRERLFPLIKQHALVYGVGMASVEEIDRINILQASLLAMKRAVAAMAIQPEQILVDGNKAPEFSVPVTAIIKGDQLEPAISAASILAKVTRDALVAEYDQEYPDYQFAKHKGYPTKLHRELLLEFGPTPYHRRSFGPVKAALLVEQVDF